MVGMAVEAAVCRQPPVEKHVGLFSGKHDSLDAFHADVVRLMAACALHGDSSPEWLVAGEALLFCLCMSLHQRTRIEEAVRKRQCEAGDKCEKPDDDETSFHVS